MKEHYSQKEHYKLDTKSIDRISGRVEEFLIKSGAVRREAISSRLASECCLEIWRAELGEDNECILQTGSKYGRKYLQLKIPGPMKDPTSPDIGTTENESEMQMFIDNSGFLAAIGYMPEYRYVNGNNILRIWAPIQKKAPKLIRFILPVAVCILVLLIKVLFPQTGQFIYDYAVHPVYSVFLRMLSIICGPFVLFSVVTSICGMGDMVSFGKTGSLVLRRFIGSSFVLTAIAGAFALCFFPIEWAGNGKLGAGMQSLIQMIVEIVPSDIATPFTTGNSLQIVFLGIALGFVIMFLSGSVRDLSKNINQIHRVVLQAMRFLGMLMPIFMVTAILKLILTSSFSQIAGIVKPVLIIWVGYLVMIIAKTIMVSVETGTSVKKLLVSTFSASWIAFTTSSSTAALDKMNENCTEKLGVDENTANFAIPIGQVIYKPPAEFSLFVCALFAAYTSGIPISPTFILMNIVVSCVIGMSMAPVAGAMISCISILYLQLGIPQDCVALGIGISLLLDNPGTSVLVQLLQEEVYALSMALKKSK